MWIKITDTNLEEGKWYKTAIQYNGEYEAIQVMKRVRGLWWTEGNTYTYYQPSHVWKD